MSTHRAGRARRVRPARRWRIRPLRVIVVLLAVLAIGVALTTHRPPAFRSVRRADKQLASSVARSLGARFTVLHGASGAPDVFTLSALATPTYVLVDGYQSGQSPRVYPAELRWSGGKLSGVRLGTPLASSVASEGDYGLGGSGSFVFYATAVSDQFQTVSVLRNSATQRWLFALPAPASKVQLSDAGGVLGIKYLVGGRWASAQIALDASGPHVVSGRLVRVSTGQNHNSLFIQVVEGVRQYFGSAVVTTAENIFYQSADTLHRLFYHATGLKPQTPSMAASTKAKTPRTVGAQPGNLPHDIAVPSGWPKSKGEGAWAPVGPVVGGAPSMEETFLHPDPQRPWATAYLVWINPSALRLHYVAGTQEPNSLSGIHGSGLLPTGPAAASVVAAFNSGFKSDTVYHGQQFHTTFGAMVDGILYSPPVPGIATLAIYKNGHVALGAFGTPSVPTAGILSYRQNLPLIVESGKLNPLINDPSAWGIVVGNSTYVWRSGIGITQRGDLVYVGGDPLSVSTLAQSLQAAGAVRAMQLDINSYWVTFNFYHWVGSGSAGYLVGEKLASAMTRPADRYLSPDTRDFFYLTKP